MPSTSAAAADIFSQSDLFSGLAGQARVAIAVSGGSDSMALLALAVDWARVSEVGVVALTVDHGLRATSADEARQVSQWCAALDIEHHVLPWTGEKPKTGIQAAARVARYDLLSGWCKRNGFPVLLTAHTLDDQAETVLMRKARTASAKSLAGIWAATEWDGVRVMRPLLSVRREALRDMLRARGQKWIDDPSNEDERFERVRVRNSMHGDDVTALGAEALDAQIETLRVAELSGLFFDSDVQINQLGFVRFERKAFQGLQTAVAHDVLARAIFVAGAGVRPPRASVTEVQQWISDGHSGRRTVAGAIIAVRLREILVAREAGRILPLWVPIASGSFWDGRFEIVAPAGSSVGAALLHGSLARPDGLAQFVADGLPVVKLPDGQVVLAMEGEKFGISAIFRERIWF